jgi:DNA-binding phage protein
MSQNTLAIELRKAIAAAERRGMTRSSIARAAKMPRSQLTRIATGESEPLLSTAERVAKAIGCRLQIVVAS